MSLYKDLNKFVSICQDLGIDPDISNFSDRLKLQKIIYILIKRGLSLDYNFSWYKHGPYSPDLTDVYYMYQNSDFDNKPKKTLSSEDIEVLKSSKKFINSIKDDPDRLEFIASLIFISNDMIFYKTPKNKETIKKKLKELKYHLFQKYDFQENFESLKQIGLINISE
jgi:uncharacterized protein YwgA